MDHGKQSLDLRVGGGIFGQRFRGPKHLIGISTDPGPPQRANLVDDVRRVGSTGSQIAAMENEVGCNLLEVIENGLEGAPIAMKVRYDCDSHLSAAAVANIA